MTTSTQTKKITIEVEVPQELASDFVNVLRSRLYDLYLVYKWLQMPEAGEEIIGALSKEVKERAYRRLEPEKII